jgi:hypothetical protein
MKVMYIAGPYRAKTEFELVQNIREAERVAIRWWQKGWAVICPHKNTAHFGGLADDSIWLEGDKEILKRCDAMCVIKGWSKSSGTLAEIELAKELGIYTFFDEEAESI